MLLTQFKKLTPTSLKRAVTDRDFWFNAKVHLLTKAMYSGIGSILALHRVCPISERPRLGFNRDLELTPELLEETILFFKMKGYQFVSLDQLYEILQRAGSKSRFVAFTLDDGYRDNLTHAMPMFKKHNVPFTVYVATCFPNRTAILWWYALEDLLLSRDEVEIELERELVHFDCSTMEKKEEVFQLLSGYLTFALDEQEQRRILRDYSDDFYKHVNELALDWRQIIELSEEPLATIGAHSTSHLALSLQTAALAHVEMLNSKKELEAAIGKPVEHFAYPFGGRRAAGLREFELLEACGFKTGTTTRTGNIFASHSQHLSCLPRIPLSSVELKKDIGYLNLWVDGLVPCHENSFQRVVTM